MRKTYCYFIRGKQHEWAINVELSDAAVRDMRADGIELGELMYQVPDWIVCIGLMRVWCFCSDVFHLRNPFAF